MIKHLRVFNQRANSN